MMEDRNSELGAELYCAAVAGDAGRVRDLLAQGARADYEYPTDGGFDTPVHVACGDSERAIELLGLLLPAGGLAAVNRFDDSRRTALMVAVANGNVELVRFLLAHGADVNAIHEDENGVGALFLAVSSEKILECLVDAGGNVEFECTGRAETSVHRAAGAGRLVALELLFRANGQAALGVQDYVDRTPLACAAHEGQVEAVQFLLSHGADVNFDEWPGDRAISRAVQGGHVDVVEVLLEAGADPLLPGHMKLDAVHCAKDRKDATGKKCLKLFREYGFDC